MFAKAIQDRALKVIPTRRLAMSYCFSKEVAMSFDEAILSVTEELKKEGFGILTEIGVKATLKEKLDVNFRNYRILGACKTRPLPTGHYRQNPKSAPCCHAML